MTRILSTTITCATVFLGLMVSLAGMVVAQTPADAPANARGVIRLRVRVASGDGTKAKGLSRKRFFLIKGSLEENKSLIANIRKRPIISRDCYYRGIGASKELIAWLKLHDCESVYCREVEQGDVEGVREFQQAVADGEKEFGNRDLARKWLSVNLADNLKLGFYKQQQHELCAVLSELCVVSQSTEQSPPRVMSAMTDINGTAYFTDLEKGTYVVSNIIPTEFGDLSEFWGCEVTVKAGDLATEKPCLITNAGNKDAKDKNITGPRRCVGVEESLPACPAK
jgi:hypothetical protein